jgi:2-C-methyl-D-erythritol 4-phosphate cytidylyltransferase
MMKSEIRLLHLELFRISCFGFRISWHSALYSAVCTLHSALTHMELFAVIIPAAGRSVRFGGPRNKLQESLAGITVIQRSVEAFLRRADVLHVVIATTPAQPGEAVPPPVAAIDSRISFTPGGDNRAQSVLLALRQIPKTVEWVAVHDAARPLVSDALIDRTLAAARQYGAAVPAMPVPLTVKQANGPLPARVQRTLAPPAARSSHG